MKFALRSGKGTPVATGPEPGDAGQRATFAAFMAVVDRVEATVEAETEALRRNLPVDRLAVAQRKRQGLLELSRVMRNLPAPDTPARERLARLAGTLETNRVALDRQLRAVREVADIVARSLKEAESDGTYSRASGIRSVPQP